jgi:hypothetical protein
MKIRLILAVVATLFVTCNKENKTVGSAFEDKDYCTCLVNGSYFKAGCADRFASCLNAQLDPVRNSFVLSCSDNNLREVNIILYDTSGLNYRAGSFELSGSKIAATYYGYIGEYRDYSKGYSDGYLTDSSHRGVLIATFDTIKNSVTGTFSFKAKFTGGNGEINVSDGKFYMHLK